MTAWVRMARSTTVSGERVRELRDEIDRITSELEKFFSN